MSEVHLSEAGGQNNGVRSTEISPELEPDIVIIGAGPVGLWTAIQIKSKNVSKEILIFERYERYERTQTLNLELASIKQSAKLIGELKAAVIAVTDGKDQKKRIKTANSIKIPVDKLEEILKADALKLGIRICYKRIEDPVAEIQQVYPSCKIIIGADGSRSTLRKTVFGEREVAVDDQLLQYAIHVTYKLAEPSKPTDLKKEGWKTRKLSNFFCDEFIRGTKVQLTFMANEAAYLVLCDNENAGIATMKSPVHVEEKLEYQRRITKRLANDINVWLNVRSQIIREQRVLGTLTATQTKISVYKSKLCYKFEHGVHWLLVGDACFGLPFFKSLNVGLQVGHILSQKIAKFYSRGSSRFKVGRGDFSSYQAYVDRRFRMEDKEAMLKSAGVDMLGMWFKISSLVPWQVNKWNASEEEHLRKPFWEFVPDTGPFANESAQENMLTRTIKWMSSAFCCYRQRSTS